MKQHTFDVTPINDETIATTMQPFNEVLKLAQAKAAESPHLVWTYTVEQDPLNEARYVLKIVGTPKDDA